MPSWGSAFPGGAGILGGCNRVDFDGSRPFVPTMDKPAFGCWLSVSLLLLTSCASVSVRNVAGTCDPPPRKPAQIYVVPFGVERAQVKESFSRKNRGELKFEARDLLTKELVAELSRSIAPACVARSSRGVACNSWIVSGEITRIEEGSRFLRMGFGLGMGGTKLDTRVEVRADSGPAFLRFATTGGSGAMPGAATNPAPFSSVPTALLHTKEGVTDDSQRTARMIVALIGQDMAKRGWIASGQIPKPKLQESPRLARR